MKELKSKQVNEANYFPKWKVFILCMNGWRMRIRNRMVQNRTAQQCFPMRNRQAELGSAVQETWALLKLVQWRAIEMFSGLEHLTWKQWLREHGLLSQGESKLRRISAMCINWVKKIEPDIAMGTKWNMWNSIKTKEKKKKKSSLQRQIDWSKAQAAWRSSESPSLQVLKTRPCSRATWPCFGQRLPKGACQP